LKEELKGLYAQNDDLESKFVVNNNLLKTKQIELETLNTEHENLDKE